MYFPVELWKIIKIFLLDYQKSHKKLLKPILDKYIRFRYCKTNQTTLWTIKRLVPCCRRKRWSTNKGFGSRNAVEHSCDRT